MNPPRHNPTTRAAIRPRITMRARPNSQTPCDASSASIATPKKFVTHQRAQAEGGAHVHHSARAWAFPAACGQSLPQAPPSHFCDPLEVEALARFSSVVRRYFGSQFNKTSGKEWEADLWALCAFVVLAKRTGCWGDLGAFLDRHPELTGRFLLVCVSTAYADVKGQLKRLANVFRPAFRFR